MTDNLILRSEQMKLIYLDGLVPVIYRRLNKMDALRKARIDAKLSPENTANPNEEIVSAKEITFIEKIEELIRKDIFEAYEEGITSKDGLLQYASYRFTTNSDNWNKKPEMMEILKNSKISESEKLQMVYDILAAF